MKKEYTTEEKKAMRDLCEEYKKFRHTTSESDRLKDAMKSLLKKEFSFSKSLKRKIYSKKGRCEFCKVGTGSQHSKECPILPSNAI